MFNYFKKIALSAPTTSDTCYTLLTNSEKQFFRIILTNNQADPIEVSDQVDNENFDPDSLKSNECHNLKVGDSSMDFTEQKRGYENCFTSTDGKYTSYMYIFVNTNTHHLPNWTLGNYGLKIQCDSTLSGSSDLTSTLAGLTNLFFFCFKKVLNFSFRN